MYWMLPLRSRIAPANVTLPLKYLAKFISSLSLSMVILTTLLNRLKLLGSLEKQLILVSYLVISDFID